MLSLRLRSLFHKTRLEVNIAMLPHNLPHDYTQTVAPSHANKHTHTHETFARMRTMSPRL